MGTVPLVVFGHSLVITNEVMTRQLCGLTSLQNILLFRKIYIQQKNQKFGQAINSYADKRI